MAISLSGVITGGAQTGLTSPAYTLTVDVPPEQNGKQSVVTSIGGTQTGVLAHSIGNPFTVSFFRPKVMKTLGGANPVTGVISPIARNRFKWIFRKGVLPYSESPALPAVCRVELDVPAGADFTDPNNLRALLSLVVGVLTGQSAGWGDTTINGVL